MFRRIDLLARAPLRCLSTSAKRPAFALDIDGVLLRGSKAIPEAQTALSLLNKKNIPWILLTNGGGKSEKERSADLSLKLGVQVSESQIIQSHTPFKRLVPKYNRVLVVGGDGDKCRHVAKGYGFQDVVISADIVNRYDEIWPFHRFTAQQLAEWSVDFDPARKFDAVLVFNDPRDAGTDTQVVLDLLLSEQGVLGTRRSAHTSTPAVPIHFSNNDLLWASGYSLPRFGQGAFRTMVEALYKECTSHELEDTIIGKPFWTTYDYADKILMSWIGGGEQEGEVYMVGDNPASDIVGANLYGWKSILVRSGVYRDGDELRSSPDHVFDNILEAVEHVVA